MTPRAAMIFAAGHGTRMGPLTRDRPKPLIEVAGRPLIEHALDLTDAVTPLRRVVNVHAHADMLRDALRDRDVIFSDETDILRETGGGLKHALPLLGPDPVFTLNSDAVWSGPPPLRALAQAWRPDAMEGLLLLVDAGDAIGHSGRGDFDLGPDGRLGRGGPRIYTGAQIVATGRLSVIDETSFSLNLLWDDMIARGKLFGLVWPGRWCDVGQPEGVTLGAAMLGGHDVR